MCKPTEGLTVCPFSGSFLYDLPLCRYNASNPPYLWPSCVADADIIFLSCSLFFFFFFSFSSPNLSRRRLDVYHTSTHEVDLSANLYCRSEMCCSKCRTQKIAKTSPSGHHRTIYSTLSFVNKQHTALLSTLYVLISGNEHRCRPPVQILGGRVPPSPSVIYAHVSDAFHHLVPNDNFHCQSPLRNAKFDLFRSEKCQLANLVANRHWLMWRSYRLYVMHFPAILLSNCNGMTAYICRLFIPTTDFLV